jgi:hypothetical protein
MGHFWIFWVIYGRTGLGLAERCWRQGCQMVHFYTKKLHFEHILKGLRAEIFVYFMSTWYIL